MHQKVHAVCFHLCKTLIQAKQICSHRKVIVIDIIDIIDQ